MNKASTLYGFPNEIIFSIENSTHTYELVLKIGEKLRVKLIKIGMVHKTS